GMDVSTDFMRVTLPPNNKCLCFHFANFRSHLVIIGSHMWQYLGFVFSLFSRSLKGAGQASEDSEKIFMGW
ncbi:hypothetical protein DK853_50560, partial [Klebsiella oxytoca]